MPLPENTTLGHYKIISKIGEGGMGEVFLAEDTRLRRRVALKVLPADIAADSDRLLRFEREAFAASALNHPNILTIFEFGAVDDKHFLVSEFVDGISLRQRLDRGPTTLAEALEIAIQILSALQAAHEAGIIHRDIKPDNVMIRADGYVKVLDFGLAKLSEPGAIATGLTSDPEAQTRRNFQTQAGIIMGTVAYMSPEQARGQQVDECTDIWSLGCVLYEMLSAQQPFRGETTTDTLANIVHREPISIASLCPEANSELERIIKRSLAKGRGDRYPAAKDLQEDLKQLKKRCEFEAELERSASPNVETEGRTQLIRSSTSPSSIARNSIAVLPFSNLSADPDNEFFCDGLAEELLNALAKIDNLKVAARTSAFSFKGKHNNVGEIGQTLGVATVLEGSVRRSANRLRITAQLVDAGNGYHLWSERYDREMQDIFDVQDEIALSIVEALKLKLFSDEKDALLKRYTDNPEVYELYLRGRYCYNKFTPEYFKKGIEYFEQAIELEPNYAPAYAAMGFPYGALFYFGIVSPEQIVPKWRALTEKALEIDDRLVDAYLSRASIEFYYDWDSVKAESSYRRAIDISPNSPDAHWRYGHFLATCERFDEAITEAERAMELDPLSLVAQAFVARIYLLAHRIDKGLEQLRKTQAMEPNFGGAFTRLGALYLSSGRYEEAIEAYKKSIDRGHFVTASLSYLGSAYALAGKADDAYRILNQLFMMKQRQYVSPFCIARIYGGLGENDKAFEWFEKAFKERSGEMVALRSEGMAHLLGKTIVDDPRFEGLLLRIGITGSAGVTPAASAITHIQDEGSADTVSGTKALDARGITTHEAETKILPNYSGTSDAINDVNQVTARATVASAPAFVTTPNQSTKRARNTIIFAAVVTALVAATAVFVNSYRSKTSSNASIQSIAVMPFVNASGNADVEYLADGLTDSLIFRVSQLPKVKVSPTSSVMRFKGTSKDVAEVAKELDVNAVMTGRLMQVNDNLSISVQLVDARTQKLIWAEQYDRKMADLLATQREIATTLTQKMQLQLASDERGITKKYTSSNDAYQLYLKGRYHWSRRTKDDLDKAIDSYKMAIELDPNFALAYAATAEAYNSMGKNPDVPPKDCIPLAKAAATRALEIDPTLPQAHSALGDSLAIYDWNWAESERHFKKALELDPNISYTHVAYGIGYLPAVGKADEAQAELERAVQLEPLSLINNSVLVSAYIYSRKYEKALAQGHNAFDLDPTFPLARHWLGMALMASGRYDDAISLSRQISPDAPFGWVSVVVIAHAYAKQGKRAEAEQQINLLRELGKTRYVRPYYLASIYAALGDKDKAFTELERSFAERDCYLGRIAVDPFMDPLRDDPRFKSLIKRMNLAA